MNEAQKYIYENLLDLTDKFDVLIKHEDAIIKFWEKIFISNPSFKKEVENYLKKINLLKNYRENDNKKLIYTLVYDYYNEYYANLNFEERIKENFYFKIIDIIRNNKNYLNEILIETGENINLIKRYIKNNGYVLNYAYKGGFIFKDGSIFDINEDDHSIINFNHICQQGIITYRRSGGDLYIKIIKDNYSYKQRKALEDIINQYNPFKIHYEIYNKDGKLIKQDSLDTYKFYKIFENKKLNIFFKKRNKK